MEKNPLELSFIESIVQAKRQRLEDLNSCFGGIVDEGQIKQNLDAFLKQDDSENEEEEEKGKKEVKIRKKIKRQIPETGLQPTRSSSRILNRRSLPNYSETESFLADDPELSFAGETDLLRRCPIKPLEKKPPSYGTIAGIVVGTSWDTRLECSYDGVHRPTVAGIHGGPQGAYSVALSGGYPEDVDNGDSFTYTGAGGRDLKGTKTNPKNLRTAPQSKDQELEGVNKTLVTSIKTEQPVRVIRGYKLKNKYAPVSGYRYDGLYKVVDFCEAVGDTGYKIYRFLFERIENQDPPPWSPDFKVIPEKSISSPSDTIEQMLTAVEFSDEDIPRDKTEYFEKMKTINPFSLPSYWSKWHLLADDPDLIFDCLKSNDEPFIGF